MECHLPPRFEALSEARRAGFLRVKDLKEAGSRIAGIFCTFTPLEILDAAGIIPVSLCGMSAETIPDAEAFLPKNLCPLIKSSFGFAVSDKCPYTYFADLIVGETTCDGKKKMFELLGERKDTYILHLPQGLGHEDALEFWTRELWRFLTFLEEKFSLSITEEALRRAAAVRNQERRARCALMELQKQIPPPTTGYMLYQTLDGLGFQFDRQAAIHLVEDLTQELQAGYISGRRPVSQSQKRILITGCPIGGVLDKTVKAIEEKGGVVVCFENCSSMKAALQMVDTQAEDIMRAIAARYLEIGCAVITPDQKRMELLPRLMEEYQVDGIVEIDLQACTPYCVEASTVRRLAEQLGVPYLSLETDYSAADSGQLSTRMEAFLELL